MDCFAVQLNDMKVLKSHRDEYFTRWAAYDFGAVGYLSSKTRFDYIPLAEMQRGDVIRSDWQIERLLKLILIDFRRFGQFGGGLGVVWGGSSTGR